VNSSQFRNNEFKKLCAAISLKPTEVKQIVENIDSYYFEWVENKVDKKTNSFKKFKDGTLKKRTIRPSLRMLKSIQAKIKSKFLQSIPLPDCVHGGVKGRSNITNAKPHQGNKYQFTTDLQEFYPSINEKRVYNTFVTLKFSIHLSHWLTKLTTWKYQLPQGSPTSTHIANLVFMETDLLLMKFCEEHELTYTRYIDDLTFSSQRDFRFLLNDILEMITSNGFKLSYRKTKYSGNQTVTGIQVFLNKIDGSKDIIKKARQESETKSDFRPLANYLFNIRKTNKVK